MSARAPRFARLRRLGGALALLPLLAACISEGQEQRIGDQIAAQVNANLPLVDDGPINLYVAELGRMLAKHSERPDVPYRFYIVNSPQVNAFALPGGHIYVNRGLLERTRNVSEMAGILAHEIGHVAARHGARNLQRQMRTRSMSGLLYRLILDRGPILDQEALDLGGQLWSAANSRSDEQEADRLAVDYLVEAGVDPRGMLSLFSGFLAEEQTAPQGPAAQWFSTHPNTLSRMQHTRAVIRERVPETEKELATEIPSYADFLRRLRKLPHPPPSLMMQQPQLPLRPAK